MLLFIIYHLLFELLTLHWISFHLNEIAVRQQIFSCPWYICSFHSCLSIWQVQYSNHWLLLKASCISIRTAFELLTLRWLMRNRLLIFLELFFNSKLPFIFLLLSTKSIQNILHLSYEILFIFFAIINYLQKLKVIQNNEDNTEMEPLIDPN